MSAQTSEDGSSRPKTPARPLSSASNDGIGSPNGSVGGSRRRARSPSWRLSSQFGDDQSESTLENVERSWEEAKDSCKLILEWDDPAYMDAYMDFLAEREAMAREMPAKVACASLKWGGESIKVMEEYMAVNRNEFTEDDIANVTAAVKSLKRKRKEVEEGPQDDEPTKKSRTAKEIVMAQLPADLSEQIDGLDMTAYTNVKDRFRRVYAHVGTSDGKLGAADLAKVLRGYSNNPKAKGLLEEEALARLIVGYKKVHMGDLAFAFEDVKSAYSYSPKEIRKELVNIAKNDLPGERMFESEKLLTVCGMKQGSVGLLEGIFLTMAGLRLAIDWHEIQNTQQGKERKKAHQDKLFEFQWRRELEHVAVDLQKSEGSKRRRKWRFEFERLVTRRNKVLWLFKKFGCIVLLDPLWSPLVTCSNTSGSSDDRSTYDTLFLPTDQHTDQTPKQQTTILGKKLDSFCHSLNLYSHNKRGTLRRKLLPISTAAIRPVLIITPTVMQCSDATCPGRALTQYQRYCDVSKVTLLRGSECFEKVPVLAGKCLSCSSMFWADHESFNDPPNDRRLAIHLPDAKYLKVGTQVWVDHLVSRAIVNANYSFHASTAAVTEFWNYSFVQPSGATFKLTRRHTWKAFVLESIRLLAEPSGAELLFVDNMAVKDLVTVAYEYLGDGGIICSAEGHSCDECCHAFKEVADVIPNQPDNPAALAGHDENHAVPEYAGPAVEDAEAMDVDDVPASDASEPAGGAALNNPADVRMIVIDGIVMGPRHCAMAVCEVGLLNAQTGVFCKAHQLEMGVRCRMKDCVRVKVAGTQACLNHQEQWRVYRARYANSSLLGVQRMLRRAQEERQEWLPVGGGAEAPEHDNLEEQEVEQVSGTKYNNYFSAPRFYCVETIWAPCGVVLAWRKFAKSEGVAKILRFLEDVYPDPASRPSYIAIDKGCALLKHIVRQGHWPAWEPTTRIIVDSYHYINHRVTDHLCRTWCNPAPLNGAAPNLVVVDEDKEGNPYYKRAFNTQVSDSTPQLLVLF
ncbi:hypothetical protein EYR38_007812 [Pleurotus pulmonarius]|nr:hypothetical protein EYR38_007812 [Pleurotus pulmonarius]